MFNMLNLVLTSIISVVFGFNIGVVLCYLWFSNRKSDKQAVQPPPSDAAQAQVQETKDNEASKIGFWQQSADSME